MIKLIAFTGKKQSGKTTLADYMVKNYGFIKVGFKDALVEEIKLNFPTLIQEIFKITSMNERDNQVYNTKFNTIDDLFIYKPPLIRKLMQEYGTDVRRKDDSSYWVCCAYDKISKLLEDGHKVVIDDTRFLNEAEIVEFLGGKCIKVIRKSNIIDTHASELEMDNIKYDGIIDNNFKLEDTYIELDNLLHKLITK